MDLVVLWGWAWAWAVGDLSMLICATVIGVMCSVNVVLWVLRSTGRLRPRVPTEVVEAA
ncbi:MAG: hypothetical protein GX632_02165 [Propioniciclava sp.]|nr:hypothetical protein [Propioniciclava sp.]